MIRGETNSNFGFNFPWWDFLLGTYRAQPRDGHTAMTIGVLHLRDELQIDRLLRMLAIPFQTQVGTYSIGDRSDAEQMPSNSPPEQRL